MDRRHKDCHGSLGIMMSGQLLVTSFVFQIHFFFFELETQSPTEVSDSLHQLHPKGSLLLVFTDGASNASSTGYSEQFPQGSD